MPCVHGGIYMAKTNINDMKCGKMFTFTPQQVERRVRGATLQKKRS